MLIPKVRSEVILLEQLTDIFSSENIPGHVSYILIALSYWLTRMLYLRLIAVAGLTLEIVYFSMSGGDLRIGVAWGIIFILINLYQLFWLIRERIQTRLPDDYRDILRAAMKGLDDAEISRLIGAGRFEVIPHAQELTSENAALDRLYFVCSGQVKVMVSGREAAVLESGSFIGEVAFMTGKSATATVTAAGPVGVLVFDRGELNRFLQREEQLAGVFYQLLGRDLAHKMKSRNQMLASAIAEVPVSSFVHTNS
jgi:CRP-like cAMP-binding protein